MSPLAWALIIPAGAAGAFARYETGRLMGERLGLRPPLGVLAINLGLPRFRGHLRCVHWCVLPK